MAMLVITCHNQRVLLFFHIYSSVIFQVPHPIHPMVPRVRTPSSGSWTMTGWPADRLQPFACGNSWNACGMPHFFSCCGDISGNFLDISIVFNCCNIAPLMANKHWLKLPKARKSSPKHSKHQHPATTINNHHQQPRFQPKMLHAQFLAVVIFRNLAWIPKIDSSHLSVSAVSPWTEHVGISLPKPPERELSADVRTVVISF